MKKFLIVIIMLSAALYVLTRSEHTECRERMTDQELIERIQGSLLGGAIGDAMGRVTEFKSIEQIYEVYPNGIRSFDDFHPQDFWFDTQGNKFAPYTDDTAMTIVVYKVLQQAKKESALNVTMQEMAKAFVHDMHHPNGWAKNGRAPGNCCLKMVGELEKRFENQNFQPESGIVDWRVGKTGMQGGGCGSVMRAHPFGLFFYDDLKKAEDWAVQHSLLTHGDPSALAACAAMAVGTACALRQEAPDEVVQKMIGAAKKYDQETAHLIAWAVEQANQENESVIVFDKLRGWCAKEAIAAAAYIFVVSPDDIKRAIYFGVHTPGDSDSIASMGGALVGARVGIKKIPAAWVKMVEGSTELMELARQCNNYKN